MHIGIKLFFRGPKTDDSTCSFSNTGQLQWIDDVHGNRQSFTYTADRLTTIEDQASDRTLTLHYDGNNRIDYIEGPTTLAVADGIWIDYGYDANGNLDSITYADGGGWDYDYTDPLDVHNLTAKKDYENHLLTSWSYDDQDRAYASISRDPEKTATINYISDTTVEVTDAYATVRTYTLGTYDRHFPRVTAISGSGGCPTCGGGDAIRYEYDNDLNITEKEYANGRIDQYLDYDELGRYHTEIRAVSTPDQRTLHYTYHPDINATLSIVEDSILNGGARVTVFDYDDDGDESPNDNPTRLLHRKIQSGYTYDAAGALVQVESATKYDYYPDKSQLKSIDGPLPDDEISYTYDPVSADLKTIKLPLTAGTTYYQDYDDAGNLRGITYPTHQQVTYVPDETDPARIGAVLLGAQTIASDLSYKPFGPLATMTSGDSVQTIRSFDKNYRITAIDAAQILERTYLYDNVGNIEDITDNLDITRSQSFGYDDLYRLTHAQGFYGTLDYIYDLVGNRKKRTHNGQEQIYEYYEGTNRLHTITAATAETFTYDDNGNTSSRTVGVNSYEYAYYEGPDRLRSITPPVSGSTPAEYIYNNSGQRSHKIDSTQVIYRYDQNGQLLAETTPTGTLVKAYIWLHGQPLAMVDGQAGLMTIADIDQDGTIDGADLAALAADFGTTCPGCPTDLDGDGQVQESDLALLAGQFGNVQNTGSSIFYYHNDHLGTPQKMTDDLGQVVWAADYFPFGQVNVIVDNVVNELRYAGQLFDSETGLHYNLNRFYDPSLGRYLRPDPIGLDGGVNLYSYVLGNPINSIDPDGECTHILTSILLGGLILIAAMHYLPDLELPDFCGDDCDDDDDHCSDHFERCLQTSLADEHGSVYGQTRCGFCKEVCEREGGRPARAVTTIGTVDCDYSKYQRID